MNRMEDDRWSIRGVARPVQRLAVEAARREGVALGPWLTRLIIQAVPDAATTDPVGERLRMLEAAMGVLSQRVTALELDQEMGGPRIDADEVESAAASPFHSQ